MKVNMYRHTAMYGIRTHRHGPQKVCFEVEAIVPIHLRYNEGSWQYSYLVESKVWKQKKMIDYSRQNCMMNECIGTRTTWYRMMILHFDIILNIDLSETNRECKTRQNTANDVVEGML